MPIAKNLLASVSTFTESMKPKDKTLDSVRELNKFVKHFQEDARIDSITPAQIGVYAETVCKNVLSPQAIEGLQSVRKFLQFAHAEGQTTINLASHFRIRKPRASSRNSNEGSGTGGQDMTAEGYEQLVTEKESLESNRILISESIHKAAADGDVKENSPLEAAREQQGREESRIKEIVAMLRTAIIVDASGKNTKRVRVGATIQVEELSKKKKVKYTLVSPSESSPANGKISDASPLGKAFIGKRAGQRATATTPRGESEFKILNIS